MLSPLLRSCFFFLHPKAGGSMLHYMAVYTRKPCSYFYYIKEKFILQQAEVALGVPGRLRPRIILTFWHYKGGRSSAIRTGRLYPRRNPWYSFSGAEPTPGHMVSSEGTTEKIPSDTPRIEPGTVLLVAQRLNHYATPGPHFYNIHYKFWRLIKCFVG